MGTSEPRSGKISPSDVIAGVARQLRAIERYFIQMPDRFHEARRLADIDTRDRELERYRQAVAEGRDPENDPTLLALHLSYWIVERADRPTSAESLAAAIEAAEAEEPSDPLAIDLREFVTGYVDGSISAEEFGRRLKKPRRPAKRRTVRLRKPAGDITVANAELRFRSMLVDAGLQASAGFDEQPPDPRAVWEVFRSFAALSADADPPFVLNGDDFLFQWGLYASPLENRERFLVDMTRQFTLHDEDGDYDHMEQLHASFWFDATPELREVVPDAIWSSQELDEWIRAVEASPGFATLSGPYRAALSLIGREHV